MGGYIQVFNAQMLHGTIWDIYIYLHWGGFRVPSRHIFHNMEPVGLLELDVAVSSFTAWHCPWFLAWAPYEPPQYDVVVHTEQPFYKRSLEHQLFPFTQSSRLGQKRLSLTARRRVFFPGDHPVWGPPGFVRLEFARFTSAPPRGTDEFGSGGDLPVWKTRFERPC